MDLNTKSCLKLVQCTHTFSLFSPAICPHFHINQTTASYNTRVKTHTHTHPSHSPQRRTHASPPVRTYTHAIPPPPYCMPPSPPHTVCPLPLHELVLVSLPPPCYGTICAFKLTIIPAWVEIFPGHPTERQLPT